MSLHTFHISQFPTTLHLPQSQCVALVPYLPSNSLQSWDSLCARERLYKNTFCRREARKRRTSSLLANKDASGTTDVRFARPHKIIRFIYFPFCIVYYFNLSKCNSNKIEKHPWKHFQLTQGQKNYIGDLHSP